MVLSTEQQEKVKSVLDKIQSRNIYQNEDGLTELRHMGDSIRPYLAYLMRAGLYGGSVRRVFSSFRDAWSARLLYELLETSSNERTAQNVWNILKTMGK